MLGSYRLKKTTVKTTGMRHFEVGIKRLKIAESLAYN